MCRITTAHYSWHPAKDFNNIIRNNSKDIAWWSRNICQNIMKIEKTSNNHLKSKENGTRWENQKI